MPRWKSARQNFSLGLCVLSSSRPQPNSKRIDSQQFVKGRHDRNRAPFAHEDRLAAEALLDRPRGGRHVGAVQRHDHARRAVKVDQLHLDARRDTARASRCFERRGDLLADPAWAPGES